MSVRTVASKNGIKIRLTAERWFHITESHDYMAGNQDMVLETLENPDYIVKGDKYEMIALKHYAKTCITEKHLIVVYKEEAVNGFVITAFMTSKQEKILQRGVLWKKQSA